eukprot:229988-Alexandrium_andersonii.AAC.1
MPELENSQAPIHDPATCTPQNPLALARKGPELPAEPNRVNRVAIKGQQPRLHLSCTNGY